MWVKPRELGDSCLFDLAGSSVDTDRLSLVLEGEDLVLRLRDAGGDHPETPNEEWSELRFAIGAGEGPGIPIDTWTHLAFDVAGVLFILEHFAEYFSALPQVSCLNRSRLERFHQVSIIINFFKVNRRNAGT